MTITPKAFRFCVWLSRNLEVKHDRHIISVCRLREVSRLRYGLFALGKILPAGSVFPFDFGYIPSTLAEDGDPLDVLLLMEEEAFVGCMVPARLIGVIEAEQTEKGKTERNDRLIAVAAASHHYRTIQTLDQLNEEIVKEIEHFFVSYNSLEGKQFKPIGRFDAERAKQLVQQGMDRFQQKQAS